jgi:hypothetical protein
MMRGVKKKYLKNKSELENIFGFGLILDFEAFLCLFEVMN